MGFSCTLRQALLAADKVVVDEFDFSDDWRIVAAHQGSEEVEAASFPLGDFSGDGDGDIYANLEQDIWVFDDGLSFFVDTESREHQINLWVSRPFSERDIR